MATTKAEKGGVLACVAAGIAVAAALVAGFVPTTVRAVEVSLDESGLVVIEHCPMCGNDTSHVGFNVSQWTGDDIRELWPEAGFKGDVAETGFSSSNEDVISAHYELVAVNEDTKVPAVTCEAVGAGQSTVTITSSEGDVVSFVIAVDDISDYLDEYLAEMNDPLITEVINNQHGIPSLTSFKITNASPIELKGVSVGQIRVVGTEVTWEANEGANVAIQMEVADPSVASLEEQYDASTGRFVWKLYPGYLGGKTTLTATAYDQEAIGTMTSTIDVVVTPGEGWEPVSDFELGQNGTLSVPMAWAEQGGYHLADRGFMPNSLYTVDVAVEDPMVAQVVDGSIIMPLKPGSTTVTMTVTDELFGGTKTATATLEVTEEDAVTVLTSEQGATLVHKASLVDDGSGHTYSDDLVWRDLTLVSTWLDGDPAYAAGDAINANVSDVAAMYVYDLHLEQADGTVFAIPEGDSVTVTLPLPEGTGTDGVRIYHVADDGTVTDMKATIDAEARTATFTTTHFSTYVLAWVSEQPAQNPGGTGGTGTTGGTQQAGEKTEAPAEKPKPADTKKPSAVPATGDAGSVAALLAAAAGSCALIGSRKARRRR